MNNTSRNKRFVPGIQSCKILMTHFPERVAEVWVQKSKWDYNSTVGEMVDWAKSKKVQVFEKSEQQLNELSHGHQGICFIANQNPPWNEAEVFSKDKSIVLVLDEIEDPHNLGSMLRTSWLMGVDGILIPEKRSASMTAAVNKVASGGSEFVPVVSVTNLNRQLEDLKKNGYWIAGLAGESSQNLDKFEMAAKMVLVIGSESKGLRTSTRTHCDVLLSIPQIISTESYNASVAASIALYEVLRQQQNT